MATPKAMDLKECTVRFADGTGTPNTLDLKIDEGNITWTETYNLDIKRDRGVLDYFKPGDEEPMKVSCECRFDTLLASSGDTVSPQEFLHKTGAASAYTSTGPACAAYAIDIIVRVDHNCGAGVLDEIITFPDFTKQEVGGDFKAGTLSFSGICLAQAPTSVRTTFV